MDTPSDDLKKKKRASILANKEFIYIQTYSGYRLFCDDPHGAEYYFKPDASDSQLGIALLDALARSRFIIPEYFVKVNPTAWRHPEAVIVPENIFEIGAREQRYNEWIKEVMKQYGYKSKRAMLKNMNNCYTEVFDNILTIKPYRHETLSGWSLEGIRENDYVVLSAVLATT